MKILISEKLAENAATLLREAGYEVDWKPTISREELLDTIGEYDALLVRSGTKVNEELYAKATRLKVVGRAGNGVDNIEMGGATKRGIIVVNTPDAATYTVAEHTIGLLLASNRRIPQADAMIRRQEWDRTRFKGSELMGKTLGIIGVGRIGAAVAVRLKAFGMKVIGYDPYISDERFKRFQVEKRETLDELLQEADVITIHTPKTPETLGMLGAEQFAKARDGLRIVNCARGGLIDEQALYDAIQSGKVASAAIDVLADEPRLTSPLLQSDRVIFTPHLGADTFEAQQKVGTDVAKEVIKVLEGGIGAGAVNLPQLAPGEMDILRDYLMLGESLGRLYYNICKDPIESVRITFSGDAALQSVDTISLAVLKGLFEPAMTGRVNYVNAHVIAEEEGVAIAHVLLKEDSRFRNRIKINVMGSKGKRTFAGMVAAPGDVRITRIENYHFDLKPTSNVLIIRNQDKPGMIGHIGTVLGDMNVNISTIQTCPVDGVAMDLLTVDREIRESEFGKIKSVEGIESVAFVKYDF